MVKLERIEQAVAKGMQWLKAQQNSQGGYGGWGVGSSSLAVMALLNAGLPFSDEAVAKGISHILDCQPADSTYFRSLTIMALSSVQDKNLDFLHELQENVSWLIKAQGSNPADELTYGGWGHTAHCREADGSNTPVALLALHAASLWGVDIPAEVWHRSFLWYRRNYELNQDGSCVFCLGNNEQFNDEQIIHAVTSGALAALKSIQLFAVDEEIISRAAELEEKIAGWLDTHSSFVLNPKGAPGSWYYNYLFSLYQGAKMEDVSVPLGNKDWYSDAVELLIEHQQPDGSWVGEPDRASTDVVYTSLALLSLTSFLNGNIAVEGAGEPDLFTEENPTEESEEKTDVAAENQMMEEANREEEDHKSEEERLEEEKRSDQGSDSLGKGNIPQELAAELDLVKKHFLDHSFVHRTAGPDPDQQEAVIDPAMQLPVSSSWPNQATGASRSSAGISVDREESFGLNRNNIIWEILPNQREKRTLEKGKSAGTSAFVYGALLCALMLGFFANKKGPCHK
ncbi:MAG: hypothetical protein GX779_00900 [Clostridia bacterium]|nr:hypothetical protein [Clostridia bacterium]